MLRSRRLSIMATWVALVAAVLPARAQDVTRSSIRTSEVHSVTSTVGGEEVDYQIVVSVPLDYEASSDAYSVVYYMDAWYAAGGIEETYHWLRAFNDIPPLILVGVSWNTDAAGALYNRSRDLTPTAVPSAHSAMLPISGGGQDFFRFLSAPSRSSVWITGLSNSTARFAASSLARTMSAWLSPAPAATTRFHAMRMSLNWLKRFSTRVWIVDAEGNA